MDNRMYSPASARRARDGVGLDRRPLANGSSSSVLHGSSLDHNDRSSSNTPVAPFQRSSSAASIRTEISRPDTPLADDGSAPYFSRAQGGVGGANVQVSGHDDVDGSNNSVQLPPAASRIMLQTAPPRASKMIKGGVRARLTTETSYGGKMTFELSKEITTIGRKEDNDIPISDGKISKYHAEVLRSAEGYFIRDKNSSNGVRVNGNLIVPGKPTQLKDGTTVEIGGISLEFHNTLQQATSSLSPVDQQADYLDLVTILPSEFKYEETVTIRAELETEEDVGFSRIEEVDDVEVLKQDYEKLRLAYELSKMSVTDDIGKLLAKSMELIFDVIPIDRGVVLLVDQNTAVLSQHYVKLREGKANENREILLSSTILQKVYTSHKCLISSDACEDPMLGKAASIMTGQIRSVICVPLVAHNIVHGILHLDSRDRISSFSSKDLSLVKAISNQTAMVIENMNLIKEVAKKARITEQLSRFLPPHVVEKMKEHPEIIRKGGRETVGTVIFADIRGFTNLSEKSTPAEVVNLLNDYFERLVKIVFRRGGIVDKYVGDALMAVFGTLVEDKDAEYRSVVAALEFQEAIRDMNTERMRSGKDSISIGVGVNTGELLAGFIGSSQRLEYTCIGDTVNTSSRMCDLAQKDQVLISERTYECVKDRIECNPFGYHLFKGKIKEVMVYQAIRLIRPS
ncbi:hypothetical protein BATDEDRAFT_35058 [Batrachochytrium dendrobatidis JAM81]|uniref:Adenylate cyclase n=2 Tax=Batrachochytrium dendrobatidis TaxID=109871 RepID=F4P2U9_BATDJ|nr:uncharacterized protein BATDEDRAFT_35058 [Batrachochytrium dendrobatidis JAM81]EGF80341.1 hypothetical protein BATDEDRAFT_35058 [Batrachochytrium dendrobatidis JAM81]KAJ8326060.1 hypothetical protein O5D80_005426 [Batrachochytrium dendrobatidis]KAK5666517.1 hypothetical protein QVD99_006589 [Batrachochytrium dendrobatidis]OAJ41356.1 hypothetical protein BDEG_24976 [Batrachochytrium dendrobatidis JEL423]|eukprot:XP_006679093.1 hypothetical protein BATDEDRAFT_35058 [Batrachochytrium dendrobatidis JAM81]